MSKNRGRCSVACVAALLTVGLLVATSPGAPVYDSGSFESPRFLTTFVNPLDPTVVGNLRGQDVAVKQWGQSGGVNTPPTADGATAMIQTATVQSGTQAVRVDRFSNTNGDARWAPSFTTSVAIPNNLVQIAWGMNVTPTTTDFSKFGPFFGIEAYGEGTTGNRRLGGAGVDATTGELLYEDPFTGFTTTNPTGVGYQPGPGFHNYVLTLDYGAQQYSVSVDGTTQFSNRPFLNMGKTQFQDADISTLQAAPTGFDNPTGTAYFDNYSISTVPEPAGAALIVGLGSLGLLLRRPQQAVA